jgi:hypothetical protein
MNPPGNPSRLSGLARILNWRRVLVTLVFSFLGGMLLSPGWEGGPSPVLGRALLLGLLALLVFGLFERWPRRLPARLARWVLQVSAVGLAMPAGTLAIYVLSTPEGALPFWQVPTRMEGFTNLSMLGLFMGPWVALGALVRQREALVRDQALGFALERSELERQALDARLRLVQAQVTPHFLFNTLANVQVLVDQGSPQASEVLRSLVAYLRAAVPRLDDPATSMGEEVQLVRAYLELMHLRMPDRLQFRLDVDAEALSLRCPPMTLLTLVENAVRHGIDPSEEGGRIEVRVYRHGDRCHVLVSDTGVGLGRGAPGLGTGLSGLRERLALIFGGEATLRLAAHEPHGVRAELDFPARAAV